MAADTDTERFQNRMHLVRFKAFVIATIALFTAPAVAAVHICSAAPASDFNATQRQADNGDALAECALGNFYFDGNVVAADPEQARKLFELAAAQGKGCGYNGLGNIYSTATGVSRDDARALVYYKRAYAQHYPSSPQNIGRVYYNAQPTPNYRAALRWYLISAAWGCSEGYHGVGEAYEFGYGVAVDGKKAEHYLLGAAKSGMGQAAVDLGTLYLENKSMRDYPKALRWFTAVSDFDLAKYQIGEIYYHGYGVGVDKARAFGWFYASAQQGYGSAQAAVGRMLSTGDGIAPDQPQSIRWYEAAAANGEITALFMLGMAYSSGRMGAPLDPVKAEAYFERAAAQGDMDSLSTLGVLYRDGEIQKDPVKAYAYTALAGRVNPPDADEAAKLKSSLTPAQLDEAKKIMAAIPHVLSNFPPP